MKQLSTQGKLAFFGGAASGCFIYGLLDGIAVISGTKSLIDAPFGLLMYAIGTAFLVAFLPGVLSGWLLDKVRRDKPSSLDFHSGFFSTMWVVLTAEIALVALADPPPGQPPSVFQNPVWLVFPFVLFAVVAWRGLPRRWWVTGMVATVALAPVFRVEGTPAKQSVAATNKQLDRWPNVLFVTLDTTRADHIGSYGYDRVDTPAFDALAEKGWLFEKAFSQIAVTGPSHLTMFSGLGPWSHSNLLNGLPIPKDVEILPEKLLGLGYETGAFVSAYVLSRQFGFDRGFRVFDDEFEGVRGGRPLLYSRLKSMWNRRMKPHQVVERLGGDTVDLALRWLKQRSEEKPWMLWVHLFDAHGPYEPPAPYDTRYYSGDPRSPDVENSMAQVEDVAEYLQDSLKGIRDVEWVIAQYDGEIAYQDAQLQRLLDALDSREDGDDTIVVVVGDHGESLGDNGIWFDHGDDLYTASTHVPLVIAWPGAKKIGKYSKKKGGFPPAGKRIKNPVELTDLYPTLLESLRLPIPEKLDGESQMRAHVVPYGADGGTTTRGICFDRVANVADRERVREEGGPGGRLEPKYRMSSLRTDDWLYIHREAPVFPDALYALEALEEDRLNVVRESEDGRSITQKLQDGASELLVDGETSILRSRQPPTSPAEKAKLKALGYLD